MSLAVTADEAQLGLKVAFLVLLYLFIWLVVRSATRGLSSGAPQESIVLPAAEAAALRAAVAPPARTVVVRSSPALQAGHRVPAHARRRSSGAAPRTRSGSTPTRPSRTATPSSTPAPTASGSRTRARRTARSSTAPASRARGCCSPATSCGSATPTWSWRAERAPRTHLRDHRHRPQAAAERGRLRLRAAALRDRGRDGRRAGRRARLEGRGGRDRGVGGARRGRSGTSSRSSARRTPACSSVRCRIRRWRGWARRRPSRFVDEEAGTIAIAHVGDSRAYRYREGVLEQLTSDHSLVGELVRSGRLTEDEAAVHPHRSVITRALGTEPEVEIDTIDGRRSPRRPAAPLLRRPERDGPRRRHRRRPRAHGRRSPARAARSSSARRTTPAATTTSPSSSSSCVEGDPVPRQPAETTVEDVESTGHARAGAHRGGRPAPRRGQGQPLARPAASSSSCWP